MYSPFQLSTSGSIEQSTIDRATADALIHATDGFMIYLGLGTFFGGVAVSTALVLVAEVRHPIVIYLALTAAISLTALMGLVLFREGSRVRELRRTLAAPSRGLNFVITPAGGGPTVSSSPGSASTGAGSQQQLGNQVDQGH